jgi:hypothetical protein
MLSEVSQVQKVKGHGFPNMWKLDLQINVHMNTYMIICIYMYKYRERQREQDFISESF